jgi:hypothetical protein
MSTNIRSTIVNLNGGQIYSIANFLPVSEADILLLDFCCRLDDCYQSAQIVPAAPYVERVYITSQKYFSENDLISIYLAFSDPVVVIGNPRLRIKFIDLRPGKNILYRY